MQTRHVLGLSFALLVACGGRTGLDLDDELRGGRGGSVTALGGAGLGTAATGAGGMGGAHAGGGAMTITGSSGAAPAVNAGAPGGGTGSIVGGEISGWQVVSYNSAMGAPDPPAKAFSSVWADGPQHAWFIEELLGEPMSRRLVSWQNGVMSTEPTSCNTAWTVRGGASNDLWLAGCTAGLLHKETGWTTNTTRHGNWVWESSPNDLWSCCEASGADSTYSAFNWDGSSWKALALPSADYKGGALWSAGPNDLWIADRDVLHWDGAAWHTFSNPYVLGWRDVWGEGDNVWAVGANTTIARWDGSDFQAIPTQMNGELEGVWGRRNDVWFVGLFGAILHWDGVTVTPVASPVIANLSAVWSAGDTLWVTGSQETLLRRTLVR